MDSNKDNRSLPFKERIRHAGRKSWIAAGCWGLLYILFILWVSWGHWQSLCWLLLLPVIGDMFITQYIPWTWWKKIKNPVLYTIMSWVDAIVFALVAVYFINLYLFQNYQIPSSSLEKSLRVGDFLYVSKAGYGPRIPNTPLSFPLVQHTFPAWLGGGKSYIDKPHWEYRRLPGYDTPEKGDIIVFNFPAGDTVCTNMPNPDYYTLRYYYGEKALKANKKVFGDIVVRPVDRRENYVKRCVGTPGDTLQIIDNQVYINGQILEDHEGVQYCYYVQTDGSLITKEYAQKLGISKVDYAILNSQSKEGYEEIVSLGLDPKKPVYHFPLTKEMKRKLASNSIVDTIVIEPARGGEVVYPLNAQFQLEHGWTRDNYGPIYLPKKGDTILLTHENYPIYSRCIHAYEQSEAKIGDTYTFKMDYYWMMGDNRHMSADSRYWGFVPEDHIVGQPRFIWLSIEADKPWGKGHIRWNRIGREANQ